MHTNPYSPPKAEVKDVQVPARSLGIRTFWFAVTLVSSIICLFVYGLELFGPLVTPPLLAVSAILGMLITLPTLRAITAVRSATVPWWSTMLYCTLFGLALFGAIIDTPAMLVVAQLSFTTSGLLVLAAVGFVERRHHVRIYTRGRGYVFVQGGREL